MIQDSIELGNRIRVRRKALHMKQSELAELLDISNNHMSSIENGKQKPTYDILIKLCEHLQTTPNHLILGCMYPQNIKQDVVDALRLCNDEQIQLTREFVELLYLRNFTKI